VKVTNDVCAILLQKQQCQKLLGPRREVCLTLSYPDAAARGKKAFYVVRELRLFSVARASNRNADMQTKDAGRKWDTAGGEVFP
jgi:hypothetical protein